MAMVGEKQTSLSRDIQERNERAREKKENYNHLKLLPIVCVFSRLFWAGWLSVGFFFRLLPVSFVRWFSNPTTIDGSTACPDLWFVLIRREPFVSLFNYEYFVYGILGECFMRRRGESIAAPFAFQSRCKNVLAFRMTRTSIDRFFLVTFPNDALSTVVPSGQSKRIGRRVPIADFPRQMAAALIPVPQWCKFCLQRQRKEWLSGGRTHLRGCFRARIWLAGLRLAGLCRDRHSRQRKLHVHVTCRCR